MNNESKEITDIPGFPNYGADRKGNIYSYNYRRSSEMKMLKPQKHTEGYSIVTLFADGKQKVCYVHRLIAKTFIPNTKNKKMLDHINHDRKDNRVENLRWVTRQENAWNTKATGTTFVKSRRSDVHMALSKLFCFASIVTKSCWAVANISVHQKWRITCHLSLVPTILRYQ